MLGNLGRVGLCSLNPSITDRKPQSHPEGNLEQNSTYPKIAPCLGRAQSFTPKQPASVDIPCGHQPSRSVPRNTPRPQITALSPLSEILPTGLCPCTVAGLKADRGLHQAPCSTRPPGTSLLQPSKCRKPIPGIQETGTSN